MPLEFKLPKAIAGKGAKRYNNVLLEYNANKYTSTYVPMLLGRMYHQ